MEQLHDDYSSTILGYYFSAVNQAEACNDCDEYNYINCKCLADDYRCTAVLVTLMGCPVRSVPSDATYCIKIWDFRDIESRCTIEHLHQIEPLMFSISATVCSNDMEHMYKDVVKEYIGYLERLKPSSYDFKAPVARTSYIKDFKKRVNELLNTKDREHSEECDHVKQRKKGHSHA